MASTPSAFRHSIIASTARIERDSSFGPFLVGTAAIANLLVQRHHMTALVALAVGLVVLEAPEQRGGRPQERQDRPDEEPEHERAALPAADDRGGEAAEKADDEELHGSVRGRGWPR